MLCQCIGQSVFLPLVVSNTINYDNASLLAVAKLHTADDHTYEHCVATGALMYVLAQKLGMGRNEAKEYALAGLLHDVGKALMPADILNKPSKLTREEFATMREHVAWGLTYLRKCGIRSKIVLEACAHHHERLDGTGYPHQLKGDAIGLAARMCAVCDVYDALTSVRPYKKGWVSGNVISSMYRQKEQYDPDVLAAFIKIVGVYPVGTLVRLKSEKLGVVTQTNHVDLLKPKVRIFFDALSRSRLPVNDIVCSDGREAVVKTEDPEHWGWGNWSQDWVAYAA